MTSTHLFLHFVLDQFVFPTLVCELVISLSHFLLTPLDFFLFNLKQVYLVFTLTSVKLFLFQLPFSLFL